MCLESRTCTSASSLSDNFQHSEGGGDERPTETEQLAFDVKAVSLDNIASVVVLWVSNGPTAWRTQTPTHTHTHTHTHTPKGR